MRPLRCLLLVDDDPTARYLARRWLERMEEAVYLLEAATGQEALFVVRARSADDVRTSPDLILLDVRMPVMDGWAFLEAYRALPVSLQSAPVVLLLTTPLSASDRARAERLSVAAYLDKPLRPDALRALVQALFSTPPPCRQHVPG